MFIFLDTETTGNGPHDRLCQLAFKTDDGLTVNELYNPGMPISIEAMSIHHLTNEMVRPKPPFRGSAAWNRLQDLFRAGDAIMVAHNAAFDLDMLKKEGVTPQKYLCTLKLARHFDINGEIPQYGLQYLRYYLGLKVTATPHTALGDILVLEALFRRIHAKAQKEFGDKDIEGMIEVSCKPILIRKMPFGKHRGTKMEEVPPDYLKWLATTDLDADLKYTVDHYLKQ